MANVKISGLTPATVINNADRVEIEQAGNSKSATIGLILPSGLIVAWGDKVSSAPSGWLKCDGSAVSRTTYPDLFAAIGTEYGNGDGSTTFNLPLDEYQNVYNVTDFRNLLQSVTHNLGAQPDEMHTKVEVSDDSGVTYRDVLNTQDSSGGGVDAGCELLDDGTTTDDLFQIKFGVQGLWYLNKSTGATVLLSAPGATGRLRVTVQRRDVPKGSIIKI